jgi:hypothetical protein
MSRFDVKGNPLRLFAWLDRMAIDRNVIHEQNNRLVRRNAKPRINDDQLTSRVVVVVIDGQAAVEARRMSGIKRRMKGWGRTWNARSIKR